jgi:uncharacterized protein (DUF2249 family)
MTDTMTTDPVRLDVRPIIGAGEEPFETIIAAADSIAEGGVLELTAPFQPVPLYPVMRQRGFAATSDQRAPDEWVVRFRQTGITTESLLAGVAERHPATVEVLAKYGFDLCCGGAKPIEVAARAHGVDLDVLLDELQARVGREQ